MSIKYKRDCSYMLAEGESERSFFEQIIYFDKVLFRLINAQSGIAFWDDFFVWMRTASSWYFLYFIIFIFIAWKHKWLSLRWLTALALLIFLCDGVSSHLIKGWVGRIRPFDDSDLASVAQLILNYRPANASFPSSHAANHAGLAFFFSKTFYHLTDKKYHYALSVLFFLWVLLIGYAQIYVGVHFPLDILGGIVIGLLIAMLHYQLLRKWVFPNAYLLKHS